VSYPLLSVIHQILCHLQASNDFGLDDFAQQNSFIFGDLLADSYDFAQLDSSNFVTQDASGPVGKSILLGVT
jgi:hypothetical protein